MKRILLLVASLAAIASLAGVATPAARAYGNTAQYQVGFSLNCDNRSAFFCTNVVGLGGFWGWYAFNNDGTFDATLTFCAHGQGFNGAFHQNVDGIWKIDTTSQPIFPGATTQTFWTSSDNGVTWSDTQMPAAPSHYSFKPAPGISAEATVTLIPGR
jgi:hypothetical protein